MKTARLMLALVAAVLAGCSGTSGLTTSSILGGEEKPAEPSIVNDPTTRAFQVGRVSARAVKCGFYFDPAKLKASYLQYESKQASAADLAKIEKIYDVSFNGVAKAVAGEADYCTAKKTKTIKADLSRHLAGDYTPSAQPKVKQEEGLFSGWGGGGSDGKGVRSTISTDNSGI